MKKLLSTLSTAILAIGFFLSPVFVSLEKQATSPLPEVHIMPATAEAVNLGCGDFGLDFECNAKELVLTWFEIIFYDTSVLLAGVSALLVDYILEYSIDSQTYNTGMIELGWEMVRDLTNIGFIFALLISAFQIALGTGEAGAKSRVLKTILVALTVNFSLFISYTIIDASNILAHVFYNKIEVTGKVALSGPRGDTQTFSGIDTFAATKSPSIAVLRIFNPQKIINSAELNAENDTESGFLQYYFIILLSSIINVLVIWIFISVAIIFLSRIIGLMMLSIAAPLAMISLIIPGLQSNEYIGFSNWFSQLFKLAFTAPIYLFFLFLVIKLGGEGGRIFSLATTDQGHFLGSALSVILPFSMVLGMLWIAKKITTDMSGSIGGAVGKGIGALAGVAVAGAAVAATGGAALAGGALSGLGKIKPNSKIGARLGNYGSQLTSAKLDVTKIPGFSKIAGGSVTKVTSSVLGKSAFGHANTARAGFNDWKNEKPQHIKDREELKDIKVKNAKAVAENPGPIEGRSTENYREWKKDMDEAIQKAKKDAEKAKEDALIKKAQEKAKDEVKHDDEGKERETLKKDRDLEKEAYEAMIDNADNVKEEEKALKGIEEEIKNLNSQLNSAKGAGASQTRINSINESINVAKVKQEARKKGIELTDNQATDFILNTENDGDGKKAIKSIKDNENFGEALQTKLSTGGRTLEKEESYKTNYEHKKSKVQKEEKRLLDESFKKEVKKIIDKSPVSDTKDLTGDRKKEYDILRKVYKQKRSELLTDSSKESKKKDDSKKK